MRLFLIVTVEFQSGVKVGYTEQYTGLYTYQFGKNEHLNCTAFLECHVVQHMKYNLYPPAHTHFN